MACTSNSPQRVSMVQRPASFDGAPIGFDELAQRCLGSIALMERLLASFDRRFPPGVEEIADSLAAGDTARLVRCAHQLKGAAANMSAPTLKTLLERIEHAARAGDLSPITGYLGELEVEWQRYCQYRAEHELPDSRSLPAANGDGTQPTLGRSMSENHRCGS